MTAPLSIAGQVELREGQFAVVKGRSAFTVEVVRADTVTPAIIKTKRSWGSSFQHTPRSAVFAAFDTKEEAQRLADSIFGVRREFQRRVTEANEAAKRQIVALVAKAREAGI